MIIRTETEQDYELVYQLNVEAFGNRNDEAELVNRIRQSDRFVPGLSIIAEQDGGIVGYLLLSKADVVDGDTRHDVIVLAPIAVSPHLQKQGIGRALMEEGIKRCKALHIPLVLLIGHPWYYPKFGFRPARPYGLELKQFPVSDDVFMVLELRDGALRDIQGELVYPGAFFG
ncbi:GNAT family N-acetyltransferase [Paenibacillus xylaniclasticus]|uniref:GNAT family N-acetyltransferase n=1 Tax=Paenibacillus xylaniclasticus TaxID=588083 RepID=UPI000FD74DC9|nr:MULTISPECIES: N-acetyltransferase [Paenibacillus]GFN33516.1 N-acetyltransferase [Paenibacillus curdlanolyticus]